MSILLSGQTPLQNASPWSVGSFRVDDKPIIIKAFGLGVDDLVCVRMVLNVQVGSADISSDKCKSTMGKLETKASSEYLRDCGVKVCICAKQPWTVISLSGDYELEVSGANIQNGSVTVTADAYIGSSLQNCAVQCAVCEPVVAALPPVTQAFTTCPLTFPVQWEGSVYATPSLLKAAIESQIYGAIYRIASCTITAPNGTALPPAPSAAPVSQITGVACPITFPVVFENIVCSNLIDLDAAIESYYGVVVTTSSVSPCEAKQTSGQVGALPASIAVAAPPPPVTAPVTGLSCPLPASLVWNGVKTTLSTFIADVQSQVPGATYNGAACTFNAPAGSVFPALVVSAPPVSYCPSQPLLDGGYGYHVDDPKDPAATVEIAPCAGDTSVDSIWVYPTPSTGKTAKVTSCDGATVGYGVNQSDCAVTCPCPDMSVIVNNAAPVNNFAPTTNVAAPNVTLPAPNVVAAGFDANGKLTITKSDGGTVSTADLPSC